MRILSATFSLIALFFISVSCSAEKDTENGSVYHVSKLDQSMVIDGNWEKTQWQGIEALNITNYMGAVPGFHPEVKAKIMYDNDNVYVIFQVKDKYVRCVTNKYNGPVFRDACVEFFFAPDSSAHESYFNLETNCGGTALMEYHRVPKIETKSIPVEDIKTIEMAHSLPEFIDPEMTDPVTWTLEYRIPLTLLEKHASITRPAKGVVWRANLYKIAENNSNPHYITWSVVKNDKPNFHLPQFFGKLLFE